MTRVDLSRICSTGTGVSQDLWYSQHRLVQEFGYADDMDLAGRTLEAVREAFKDL